MIIPKPKAELKERIGTKALGLELLTTSVDLREKPYGLRVAVSLILARPDERPRR